MKLPLTLLLTCLSLLSLPAQTLVPLSQNNALPTSRQNEPPPAQPKYTCDYLERPGVTYVVAADTGQIDIDIDTDPLGLNGAYSCLNCDQLEYGTALVEGERLIYIADPDVVAGKDIVEVEYCAENGCATRAYHFIARRAGQVFAPPAVILEAETETLQTADTGNLPGPLACTVIFDCPDDYEGRDQLSYLTDYDTPVSSFRYVASRYAGADEICLVLCDTFALCDTFQYTFLIQQDTLRIPFMDDFSYPGPYPLATHWLDDDTYINNDLCEDPPSVGVATFDGLNRSGRPIGGGFGEADRLTSNYIDLSGITGDLFLSYWLQRRGRGNKPEIEDIMELQFKRADGEWVTIREFEGIPGNQPSSFPEPFLFFVNVVEEQYRHSGFQFRFKNYSERSGLLDIWHLDYVRLDRNEFDRTFSDIAFTEYPLPVLSRYTSMPWQHFRGIEEDALAQNLRVQLFNHAEQTLNADPSSVRVRERNTGIEMFDVTLFNGQEANIPNGENLLRNYSLVMDNTGFPPVWNDLLQFISNPDLDDLDRQEFVTTYRLSNASQVTDPGFEAVLRNDEVSLTTVFADYFAYDDGTAEAGLVTGQGDEVAVRFTATVDDSLRAIRLHIPHTTIDVTNQRFNLKVWVGELDDEPEYSQIFVQPVYASSFFDTLQGFTTYPLVDEDGNPDPLFLPAGDFYVGWQQESSCQGSQCIPVGYDFNTPGGKDYIWQNFGQGWEQLPELFPGGALMLRPVVGSTTPGFTSTEELTDLRNQVKIFPNPARDLLHIRLPDGRYEDHRFRLFDSTGRLLREGTLQADLPVSQLSAGLYWLEIVNHFSRERVMEKIAIAR